jgi:hypothetical protein
MWTESTKWKKKVIGNVMVNVSLSTHDSKFLTHWDTGISSTTYYNLECSQPVVFH